MVEQKHSSDDPYNFVKMPKNCETYDDFCDVERYPTVTSTCEHLTSAFKETLEILTQVSSCVPKQRPLVSCLLHRKQKWLVSEL